MRLPLVDRLVLEDLGAWRTGDNCAEEDVT